MEENQILDNMNSLGATEPMQEKMLPQSEVNKLVGRVKAEAEQKARRQAELEYQQQVESMNRSQTQEQVHGNQQIDANALYQQVRERLNRDEQEKEKGLQERHIQEEFGRAAQNYLSRVEKGHELYPDFKEVTKDFDPAEFPQLVYLVSGLENAADVVYELAKNPSKLVTIDNLAQRSPRMAQSELQKLAASISVNSKAKQEAEGTNVNDPLDRLQPSRVSGSNGKLGIRDLREQPWLRG